MLKFFKGYGLGYSQCILKGENSFRTPTLIVGANAYTRKLIDAATLQAWDVHLLFFPTPEETYQVGLLYISRIDNKAALSLGIGNSVETAIVECVRSTLESIDLKPKALTWLTHSVYRCSKVSLKDVTACEPYVKKTA